jgi:hypothetical protein
MMRLSPLLLPLLLSLLATACGSSHAPAGGDAAAASASGTGGPSPRNAPAAAPDADMVAGVSSGGSGPPISVKFRLEARPVVGAPATLVLALIPTPGLGISRIHASLRGDDGLQVQSSTDFDVDDPQDGAVLTENVTVVPQRDGVLSLSAIVVVDYDKTSVARTYVIPLIAATSTS